MSTYVLGRAIPIKALLLARVAGMALTTVPPSSIAGAMLWAGYLGHVVVTHLN
jgi:hypothetical protein